FPHVPNELIVKFDDSVTHTEQEVTLATYGGKIATRFEVSRALLVRFETSQLSTYELAKQLAQNSGIAYIEANVYLHAFGIPNDPKFGELYGLHNTGQNAGTAGADIDAPEAWQLTTGSRNVVVGVIDTGINYE